MYERQAPTIWPSATWRAGVLFFLEGDTREVPNGGFFSYPALQHFRARVMSGPLEPVIPPREPTQVRGVLVERVIVSTTLDPFLTLKALVAYSGIGLRRLYNLLSDPVHPLPHYRVGGKILVRRSEFDAWMAHYRQWGRADVDSIVDGVITDLGRPRALMAGRK